MSVVLDASVFVAASRDEEPEHGPSQAALNHIARSSIRVFCPMLILPECGGAIIRLTQSVSSVRDILTRIAQFPRLTLVPIDQPLAELAAEGAAHCRLRGADACYVALASSQKAELLTLDREMLEKGATAVRTFTPDGWLRENPRTPQT